MVCIAEVARTVVNLVGFGTLCTSCGDAAPPLGTFAAYVLTPDGLPVLRLRADALHTTNLTSDPRCSLFVQPPSGHARSLARVTLIGKAVRLDGDEATEMREKHLLKHGSGIGIDSVSDQDQFWRLEVEKVFHVGGIGSDVAAESLEGEVFMAARPDELQDVAEDIVRDFNQNRMEEVRYRIYQMSDPNPNPNRNLIYHPLLGHPRIYCIVLYCIVLYPRWVASPRVQRVFPYQPWPTPS